MAAPTILRTQHKLADYLFQPDLEKFNLPKKSSRPWIVNNAFELNKLNKVAKAESGQEKVSNMTTDVNTRNSSSTSCTKSENIMNENYIKNEIDVINGRNASQDITESLDNAEFSTNITDSKSFKVKSKVNTKHLRNKGHHDLLHNQNGFNSESPPQSENKDFGGENSHERGQKTVAQQFLTESERLQKDLELQYQNQVNQMYNDPNYADQLEQLYQPLPCDPAFHHGYPAFPGPPQNPLMFPHQTEYGPPMYFIDFPLVEEESIPMMMTPDTGSDYSSETGSCCEMNLSTDSSDDEVNEVAFNMNNSSVQNHIEEEVEVPIEMDEELNLLVLSIIDE